MTKENIQFALDLLYKYISNDCLHVTYPAWKRHRAHYMSRLIDDGVGVIVVSASKNGKFPQSAYFHPLAVSVIKYAVDGAQVMSLKYGQEITATQFLESMLASMKGQENEDRPSE